MRRPKVVRLALRKYSWVVSPAAISYLRIFPRHARTIFMKFAEIEPQARRNILRLADAYVKATGRSYSTVSRRAHSDPRFFDLLKKREVSVTWRVTDKILSWFTQNWPPDTPEPILDEISFYPKGISDGSTARKQEQDDETTESPQGSQEAEGTQSPSDRLRKLRGR